MHGDIICPSVSPTINPHRISVAPQANQEPGIINELRWGLGRFHAAEQQGSGGALCMHDDCNNVSDGDDVD